MRSVLRGKGAQGLLGALTDPTGGQSTYLSTMEALGKVDAYGASAMADRAEAALSGDALASRGRARSSGLGGITLPSGLSGSAALDLLYSNETANLGDWNTFLQGQTLRDFQARAATAADAGDSATMTRMLSIGEGKPNNEWRLNETGRVNLVDGSVDFTPGHAALANQRNAAANASNAAARKDGYLTVDNVLVDITGPTPRGLDTSPIPNANTLSARTGGRISVPQAEAYMSVVGGAPGATANLTPEEQSLTESALQQFMTERAGGKDNRTALMKNMELYQTVLGKPADQALALAGNDIVKIVDPYTGTTLFFDALNNTPLAQVDPRDGTVVPLTPDMAKAAAAIAATAGAPAGAPAAPARPADLTPPAPGVPVGDGEFDWDVARGVAVPRPRS